MEQKFDLILIELQNLNKKVLTLEENMATKQNLKAVEDRMAAKLTAVEEKLELKLDRLSKTVEEYHIESINSDEILLNEIRTLKKNIVFVNRRLADVELDVNALKV